MPLVAVKFRKRLVFRNCENPLSAKKECLSRTLGRFSQNGIEEVWGSNPHGSTKRYLEDYLGKI